MCNLWEHLDLSTPEPTMRGSGVAVATIITRLENGEKLEHLAVERKLAPADVIAALAADALDIADADGPPLTQREPPRPQLAASLSEIALAHLFPRAPRASVLCLSAGLLQIHDFWDASHHAAQEADDLGEQKHSAYWHGIAHRREPDPGNAAYWFRRVGRHPVFEPLAKAAKAMIEAFEHQREKARPAIKWDPMSLMGICSARSGLSAEMVAEQMRHKELQRDLSNLLIGTFASSVLREGTWDPMGFIAYCGSAPPGSSAETVARWIQRREMLELLNATVMSLGPAE
jgi:hypothetical protein